jgi:hypothetical protein
MDSKELRTIENELIQSITDLKNNLDSDKDVKIDIFMNIRNIINTLYYTSNYHNSTGFMFIE